ncbi:MAG: META domain-containing protein [Woeseia sp.]|jgi:heat shock protein HslJ
MKGVVAFGFFLLFLAALALINIGKLAPGDTGSLRGPTTAELTGERWRLVALRGNAAAEAAAIELQFTRGGMLTGSGLCQHFSGRYELAEVAVSFSGLQATESTCAAAVRPLEQRLLDYLSRAASIGFEGRNLVVLANDGTRLLRFVAASATVQ